MPAQHKYNKYENKKRYSSSSESSYHRKNKEHKSYHHEKWHKKDRSRSRSNQKPETKYKFTYHTNKDERRYPPPKPYQNKRADSYRKRDSEEDRRNRNDDKKTVPRYSYVRNDERDRNYQQHRKDERRQKNTEHKRHERSSSSSKSNSPPKHNRQLSRRNDHKSSYPKREETKVMNFESKNERKQQEEPKVKYQSKQIEEEKPIKKEPQQREIENQNSVKNSEILATKQTQEKSFQQNPKFPMKIPFIPPPPPSSNNSRRFPDYFQKKNQYQTKKQDPKRDQKQHMKQQKRKQEKQQKAEPKKQILEKPALQMELQKIVPFRRTHQIKKQIKEELLTEKVVKEKVGKFDMVLNQAKANLILALPPLSFMALDTFKSMNKFQIQALDKRWANSLKDQSEKLKETRCLLQSIPSPMENQQIQGRLWTFVKEQRNEAEHNLRIKFEQLKMINTNLNDMVRRLRLLQS